MRIYQLLILIATLIGFAHSLVNVATSPATGAIDRLDSATDPGQPTTNFEERSSVGPTEQQSEGTFPAAWLENTRLLFRDVPPNLDYKCGPKWGKCAGGTCCSSAGYCGTTKAHCRSPDCMIDYGQCDSHKTPKGPPTKDILRPRLGKVAYAPQEVRSCVEPGTVALTFDDGPTRYTGELLDLLDEYEAPATFFITGNNNGKGQIDDDTLPWASLIERMLLSGHQIASHTWSHEDLGKITPTQRREQMEKNEAALRNVVGSFPTYMRPPYSSCPEGSGCREDLGDLGYHIILYDIDTNDYRNDDPGLIQQSKDIFDKTVSRGSPASSSWLVIAHDAHQQTVHNLTEHMLKTMKRLGYRPVTVGDCLKDPRENWYREDSRWSGPKNKKKGMQRGPKKTAPQQVSVDGTCGANYTCLGSRFGLCCSSDHLCGNSTIHCGPGCRKDAGYCTVETPSNGDAWDPKVPGAKGGTSEADSDLRAVGTATMTSLVLALFVAMWM